MLLLHRKDLCLRCFNVPRSVTYVNTTMSLRGRVHDELTEGRSTLAGPTPIDPPGPPGAPRGRKTTEKVETRSETGTPGNHTVFQTEAYVESWISRIFGRQRASTECNVR